MNCSSMTKHLLIMYGLKQVLCCSPVHMHLDCRLTQCEYRLSCLGCLPSCRLPGLELRLRLLPPGETPAAAERPFIGPALVCRQPLWTLLCLRRFLAGAMLSRVVTLLNSTHGCRARYLCTKQVRILESADTHAADSVFACLPNDADSCCKQRAEL